MLLLVLCTFAALCSSWFFFVGFRRAVEAPTFPWKVAPEAEQGWANHENRTTSSTHSTGAGGINCEDPAVRCLAKLVQSTAYADLICLRRLVVRWERCLHSRRLRSRMLLIRQRGPPSLSTSLQSRKENESCTPFCDGFSTTTRASLPWQHATQAKQVRVKTFSSLLLALIMVA